MGDAITDGRDFLKKPTSKTDADKMTDVPEPSQAEMQEAFTPDLSEDRFYIGGVEFFIKISNIKTQKIMARGMDNIKLLVDKIDVSRMVKQIGEMFEPDDGDGEERDANFYSKIVNLVKSILDQLSPSEVMCAMMDTYANIVYAICVGQKSDVTYDWVEDNLNFSQAGAIVFRQLEKDKVQGKVVSFLAVMTRLIVGGESSIQIT